MGHYEKPFRVRVGASTFDVVPVPEGSDREGIWLVDRAGDPASFDAIEDLTAWVPRGEWIRALFGPFDLAVRRAGARFEYRASTEIDGHEVASAPHADDEAALWDLANRRPPARVPRACFFCRYSEVEKSAGWGHLCCNVRDAEAYERFAVAPRRVWPYLTHEWVDEWHGCDRWRLRPLGFGYRGGGHVAFGPADAP